MALNDVIPGQSGHAAAHNEERHAINDLLDLVGDVSVNPPSGTPAGYVFTAQPDGTAAFALFQGLQAIRWDGTGSQPLRPATPPNVPVIWICPVAPVGGGSVAGGAGKVDGLDILLRTPS